MKIIENVAPLIGRLMLVVIFIKAAIGKINGFDGTAKYMASKGMPMTSFLLFGAIVFLLVGSLSLLVGYKARIGALLLILFLLPTTLIFHPFWVEPAQMGAFVKNLAVLGGLFYVLGMGAGPLSLDGWTKKNKDKFNG